ncbi:MAG: squalene synthase HpnC [Alphaproteobacteria bacterium]|nr:squalene synthase HpnC [Alphaproteobacteria bacterium]
MTVDAAQLRSGKGSGDENFPVASWLVEAKHRRPIMAFYEFVRIADDIADHATLGAGEKVAFLDSMEATLLGQDDKHAAGVTLRAALAERGLSPQHAQDLLKAFRQDATKRRYATWDELIDYCRYSAMPVGRYVLDVHGESRDTWPASDAVCAVLQIVNHLQDCALDLKNLDRVYVPLDAMAAAGTSVEALRAERATPEMRACLRTLAERTEALLDEGLSLPLQVKDRRLALELSAIVTLARHFLKLLRERDPLSERVRLGKVGVAAVGALGAAKGFVQRLVRTPGVVHRSQADERRHHPN